MENTCSDSNAAESATTSLHLKVEVIQIPFKDGDAETTRVAGTSSSITWKSSATDR
jgi:hypothetical protein